MAQVLDEVEISKTAIVIKFIQSVKVTSLTVDHFLLTTNDATPSNISSPFKSIDLNTDYNSIARKLVLYFNANLTTGNTYRFKVAGLLDARGNVFPTESITFTVPAGTQEDPLPLPEDDAVIEDYSVRGAVFTDSSSIFTANPEFYIVSTDPHEDEGIIADNHEDGRVTLKFSAYPNDDFINTQYFKAQRKPLGRKFNRWMDVSVQVSKSDNHPWIYVDFPSLDASPVYHLADHTYFEAGYKYRVRVLGEVGL